MSNGEISDKHIYLRSALLLYVHLNKVLDYFKLKCEERLQLKLLKPVSNPIPETNECWCHLKKYCCDLRKSRTHES
jgi:hypothetical protein